MKISMQKLAEKVGVSKMTISLYLRDPQTKRISEAMKEKIEKAMSELGYEPKFSWRDFCVWFLKQRKLQRFAKLWGTEKDYE